MAAGPLDRRITLERATVTFDDLGGAVETWSTLATVWAQVLPISDGERWRAAEVGAEVTTRFRIRWSTTVADVGPKDRIAYAGRVFNIAGVKELGRREGIEITATARGE